MKRQDGTASSKTMTIGNYFRRPLLTVGTIMVGGDIARHANEREAVRATWPAITEHINNMPIFAIGSAVGALIAANVLVAMGNTPNQARRTTVGIALALGGIVNTFIETKTGLELMHLGWTPDAVDAVFGTVASGAAALAVTSADRLQPELLEYNESRSPDIDVISAQRFEPGTYYGSAWQEADEAPTVRLPHRLLSDGSDRFRMVIDPNAR